MHALRISYVRIIRLYITFEYRVHKLDLYVEFGKLRIPLIRN